MADLVQRLSKKRNVEKEKEKDMEKGQKHIDQLSNLLDSIICHILSFLPTKLSVATSTLSKRWKHLWTAVPVLSFSSAEFIGTLGSFVDSIVLEDLVVERILDNGILDMVINVASLKRLNLKNYEANDHGILISAPLLERIELSQKNFNVLNFQIDSSSLVEAIIDIHVTCEPIEEFANLEFLSLSEYALYGMAFHEFHNLVCLETTTSCANWDDLEELLHGSNNLKTVVYHIEVPILHRGHNCDKSFSKTVPVCVSASLKALKLTGFINQNCNWTFIQYMLKNAKFLEEVKIRTSSMLKKRRSHIRNMLNCPRASTECQIRFFLDLTSEEYRFRLKFSAFWFCKCSCL
ncbi:hypothetical protein F3Y22_tig00111278pilonHSYRG00107 [Hibiscus syriacus]|uniref:FBD domain-containing protein n=1 Tax=Hibiscus syriacus TaxID=106335 RepID=A0A6A2YRL9_HIBSY|nr:hypothetical protein F3Y22_tig00111278pilonHSYRG00107 [Hibiscus syriacus]